MYHEWKRSDTTQNFYWLDYGAGRSLELDACPRDRLEREQVRYLSREERQYYLVKVDGRGRMCWAKNDAPIDTTERYKDSVHGIVPGDDPTSAFAPRPAPGVGHPERRAKPSSSSSLSLSSLSSVEARREADRAAKYGDAGYDGARGVQRVTHMSASTIFNKLLRKSVRKNTWIFVADTSFRLYVGIKDSGAFQHSSFLQGSRISAAGLIKIKDGRLSSLSPLSGHYRPPASNFRAFVRSLRDAGVDMGHVSISKSYTVLVGLEAYVKTRRRGGAGRQARRRAQGDLRPRPGPRRRPPPRRRARSAGARSGWHLTGLATPGCASLGWPGAFSCDVTAMTTIRCHGEGAGRRRETAGQRRRCKHHTRRHLLGYIYRRTAWDAQRLSYLWSVALALRRRQLEMRGPGDGLGECFRFVVQGHDETGEGIYSSRGIPGQVYIIA